MDARPAPLAERLQDYWRANVRWNGATLALAAVVALGLVFRLGALRLPFDRDEGAYGTIGRGLLDGLVPYRDLFDHKPPMIYGFYALATSLGSDELVAVRGLSALVFAACIVLVFAIGRRAYGERAGVLAALAFALIGNDFTVEAARANTEQVMLLPLLASLYCSARAAQGGDARWLVLCGLAGGLAVLTKPVAVWPLAVLVVHALVAHPRGGGAKAPQVLASAAGRALPLLDGIRRASLVLAGAAAPVVMACAYFAANGALGDFYASVVTFNSEYVRYFWSNGYRDQVTDLSPLASPYAMLAFGAVFAGFLLPRERQGAHILIIAWTAANVVGAKMGVRTFGHYFVPALPGIALLSAAFVEAVIVAAKRGGWAASWQRCAPAAAAVAIAAGWQARENVDFYFLTTPDKQAEREFGQQGSMVFGHAATVADYVRANTRPDETILVLGAEPEVYFLADRASASRFVYELGMEFARETIASVRADLARERPAMVVTTQQGSGDAAVLAEEGYRRTLVAGWLEVYELAPAPATDAAGAASDVAGVATER